MTDTFAYFAYGSNLCIERLEARVGNCPVLGIAHLHGYRLAFHKKGDDGSAKCDAFRTGNSQDILIGATYELSHDQRSVLDEFEGVGRGYSTRWENVTGIDSEHSALLYVAEPPYIVDDLQPYHWYREFVLTGARQHNLPTDYVEKIYAVQSKQDANAKRRRENENVIIRSF